MTDFRYMYRSELQAYVKRLTNTANKRLQRLEQAGLSEYSRAYQYREGERFKMPTTKTSFSDLRTMAFELNAFLNTKTSTKTGLKNILKDMNERLGTNYTMEEASEFWELYDLVESGSLAMVVELGSKRVQEEVRRYVQENSTPSSAADTEAAKEKIKERLEQISVASRTVKPPKGFKFVSGVLVPNDYVE